MEQDNYELVAKAQRGDRSSFDDLVRINKDKMFALVYRMTGNRDVALDLLQETFFTAFKELKRFRGDAHFSSWLYRIAFNRAVNHLRRQKLLSFIPISKMGKLEPSYDMPDNPGLGELNSAIEKAVGSLPPKQKMIFTLRFYEQLPFKEISMISGKSESAIKTNYQKAIEKLRKQLQDFR
ncbi:MAG: RNA polymerase sigma factor [candidate division Zixibacteria bacterium]|nr:RNA polymerase sigma factor [candidate division Zixibacteria bacterium]